MSPKVLPGINGEQLLRWPVDRTSRWVPWWERLCITRSTEDLRLLTALRVELLDGCLEVFDAVLRFLEQLGNCRLAPPVRLSRVNALNDVSVYRSAGQLANIPLRHFPCTVDTVGCCRILGASSGMQRKTDCNASSFGHWNEIALPR